MDAEEQNTCNSSGKHDEKEKGEATEISYCDVNNAQRARCKDFP